MSAPPPANERTNSGDGGDPLPPPVPSPPAKKLCELMISGAGVGAGVCSFDPGARRLPRGRRFFGASPLQHHLGRTGFEKTSSHIQKVHVVVAPPCGGGTRPSRKPWI